MSSLKDQAESWYKLNGKEIPDPDSSNHQKMISEFLIYAFNNAASKKDTVKMTKVKSNKTKSFEVMETSLFELKRVKIVNGKSVQLPFDSTYKNVESK